MTDDQETHHIARQAAALDDPRLCRDSGDMTDAQDDPVVQRSRVDWLAANLREIISEAEMDRDRFAHIAATIRVNALHGGASTEEAEAMVRGEKSFIDWLADRFARPPQAGDARVAQAMEACRIIDAAVKEGHDNVSDLLMHLLEAAEPARAALAAMDTPKGGGDE